MAVVACIMKVLHFFWQSCFICRGDFGVDVKGISTLLPGLKLLSVGLEMFGVYCVL